MLSRLLSFLIHLIPRMTSLSIKPIAGNKSIHMPSNFACALAKPRLTAALPRYHTLINLPEPTWLSF